jgi:phage terminase small subunit
MALTWKQQMFVEAYMRCWNAAEAARQAGYSTRSARELGARNLRNPEIEAAIRERLAERVMAADEALARLALQARGRLEDVLDLEDSGSLAAWVAEGAKVRAGSGHLVRKVRVSQAGVEVELYNAQRALELIAKAHRLLGAPVEVGATVVEDATTISDERRAELLMAIFDRARARQREAEEEAARARALEVGTEDDARDSW